MQVAWMSRERAFYLSEVRERETSADNIAPLLSVTKSATFGETTPIKIAMQVAMHTLVIEIQARALSLSLVAKSVHRV